MTTSDNIQEVQEDITPAIKELNDLELEAIAGGKERFDSHVISDTVSAAVTSDGQVMDSHIKVISTTRSIDLPTVGGVASRAAALSTLTITGEGGFRDPQQG